MDKGYFSLVTVKRRPIGGMHKRDDDAIEATTTRLTPFTGKQITVQDTFSDEITARLWIRDTYMECRCPKCLEFVPNDTYCHRCDCFF